MGQRNVVTAADYVFATGHKEYTVVTPSSFDFRIEVLSDDPVSLLFESIDGDYPAFTGTNFFWEGRLNGFDRATILTPKNNTKLAYRAFSVDLNDDITTEDGYNPVILGLPPSEEPLGIDLQARNAITARLLSAGLDSASIQDILSGVDPEDHDSDFDFDDEDEMDLSPSQVEDLIREEERLAMGRPPEEEEPPNSDDDEPQTPPDPDPAAE